VSQVKLSWTPSTNNVGVKKYEVGAARPRKHDFCARGNDYGDELQRHAIGSGKQLQLSGPSEGCEREPERVLGGGERDNSFADDQSSRITLTKMGRGGRI